MIINREGFVRQLEAVTPGLAPREILEQSMCFIFNEKGTVQTYNDEISCTNKCDLTLTGAVAAEPLLGILIKLPEDLLDISQINGELIIKGKRRKSGIRFENEILLPIDNIEKADNWTELDDDFCEAISIVTRCASQDESQFMLTCIHITSEYIEATDRFQLVKYPIKTNIGTDMLIRSSSIKHIVGMGATEVAETAAWMHFRNQIGMTLSCRKYTDEYPDLSQFLEGNGVPVILPKGIEESVEKAEVFTNNTSDNNVVIQMKEGMLMLKGEGGAGWYKEQKQITYNGPPVKFMINAKLLVEISQRTNDCQIDDDRLIIDSGRFKFVGCLGKVE